MTVLVTGAAGFLGGHLVDLLVERGESIRIFTRPGEDITRLVEAGVEVCQGDLTDRLSVEAAVVGVDRVFHCAARTGPWGPMAEYEQINVHGTKTLVEAAMAANVRRIVHVSSITAHGVDVHGTVDETSPLNGGSDPYSRTKVASERLLQQLIRDKEAPVTIVRPGLIYGPRDTNSFARFARLIEQGKMVIIGSGYNSLPLIHVKDVAQGIVLAGDSEQALGRAYLLTSDEPITQSDYFNAIARELGVPPPRLHIPYKLALALGATAEMVGHLTHMQQSPPLMRFGLMQIGGENRFLIDRACRELGFSPQISLAEGVRHSVAWFRTLRHP
ncbi:MAG TPA: NAD-dependent epimerase/dehydratase family protein [Ktedonobacteraceae bacterium]|jgi:nucleoside-diphosphate-sugar epimerase